MSGELQTIPARHGVATFVPRGRTIKVINTYGKQVISVWAFSLGPPPEDEEEGEGQVEAMDDEAVQKEAEGLKNAIEQGDGKDAEDIEESKSAESSKKGKEPELDDNGEDAEQEGDSAGKETESTEKETDRTNDDNDDPPEQAPDTQENEKASEDASKQTNKRTWASYLPSIPYRNKGQASKPKAEEKPSAEDEKAQNEANTKKWSSYLPTGKGFSSYVPNVQVPETKDVVNAFKTTHSRDPNKSYAEQLYDFSKTPVGAGTIAAATGSGYASSVYAAYSAYTSTHPSSANMPPMEYLSLPHTRASTHKLVPEVSDELLTNLRNPIITLVEDTSPGAHDTLTAACDANLYRSLGIDKPEEHASCAVNLVLALKELNESAGLKGAKAIGADITVNIAPTPLHLFMNAPIQLASKQPDAEGAGAKGITLAVEEPKGKKRSHVRFRAERDVVIVFSACPMDVGNQNGGRCMAGNFMVEDVQEGEDLQSSISSLKQQKKAPKKLNGKPSPKRTDEKMDDGERSAPKKNDKVEEKKRPEPAKRKSFPRKLSGTGSKQQDDAGKKADKKDEAIPEESGDAESPAKGDKNDASAEDQKPKKKPKKLQVRSGGASTPAKSA